MPDNNKVKKQEELSSALIKPSKIDETFALFKKIAAGEAEKRSRIKTKHKAVPKQIGYKDGKKIYGDYLPIAFFKALLNEHMAEMWDWRKSSQPVIVGNRVIVSDGEFVRFSEKRFQLFISLGCSPDVALEYSWVKFYSIGAGIFQVNEKGNPISVSGPAKTSNIEAFKKSINMSTNYGDDTYAKDEELSMSIEEFQELTQSILELNISEEQKEILLNKSLPLHSYHKNNFFNVIRSDLPFEEKTKALDRLAKLENPDLMEAFKQKLQEREQEYST